MWELAHNSKYIITDIHLIIDGRYSTGLMLPPDEGYLYDMEPKYSEKLIIYNVDLSLKFMKYLKSKGTLE